MILHAFDIFITFYSSISDYFTFFICLCFELVDKIPVSLSRISLFDGSSMDSDHTDIATEGDKKCYLFLEIMLVDTGPCLDAKGQVKESGKFFDE
jgi:hypothetical protein